MSTACIFALDNSYELVFKVFFHTLQETSSIPSETEIFILHAGSLEAETIRRIQSFTAGYKREVHFLNIEEHIPDNLPLASGDHVSAATFYRLFIADILPTHIKTAVYLDSDMVALKSIASLFSVQCKGSLVAAVDHCSPRDQLRLWGEKGGSYFQAGVLVIPVETWRAQMLSKRFIETMQNSAKSICWWDQDILNISLEGSWSRLPVWMNVCRDLQRIIPRKMVNKNACLIHYSGKEKPWNTKRHHTHDIHWLKAYKRLYGKKYHKSIITMHELRTMVAWFLDVALKPLLRALAPRRSKFRWTNLR